MRTVTKKIDGYHTQTYGMITVEIEYKVSNEWAEQIVVNHKTDFGKIIKQENMCKLYNRVEEIK